MSKITQLSILFFLVFSCTQSMYGQECSVSLSGTYQLDPQSGEGGLYEAFVFDGTGKVDIHAFTKYKGDFFQVGDTIVVYPDKSIFRFLKKDEHTLIGTGLWLENLVYKRMENDTLITPMQVRSANYATQFYEFYKLTERDELNIGMYMGLNMDADLQASMKKLCDEGFPKACITMANALMMNSPEMWAFLRDNSDNNEKKAPNKDIFQYFMKAIELNELDAIAQLGAYFLMLGHEEEAKKVFEKGCELGHNGCCMSLIGLEIDWEEE